MTTKKIPISFNDQDQANVKELIDLIGITNVHGDIPKAVKFGITLAISAIKNPEKVYHHLNDSEMEQYLSSVARFEKKRRMLEKARNLKDSAKKV